MHCHAASSPRDRGSLLGAFSDIHAVSDLARPLGRRHRVGVDCWRRHVATSTHACTRTAVAESAAAHALPCPACAALPRTSRAAVLRGGEVSMSWDERTYIMIKPDGVQRGLVGEITKRFEQRGYKLQALKLFQARATSAPAACSL